WHGARFPTADRDDAELAIIRRGHDLHLLERAGGRVSGDRDPRSPRRAARLVLDPVLPAVRSGGLVALLLPVPPIPGDHGRRTHAGRDQRAPSLAGQGVRTAALPGRQAVDPFARSAAGLR